MIAVQFRKYFGSFLSRFTAKSKARGAPAPMQSDEKLSRFIFEKRHLYADGRPKHNAFLPARDLKTSVFRKSRMSDHEYEYTQSVVATQRQAKEPRKKLVGAAIISVTSVREEKLEVEPEESDLKWHADIVGWPEEKQKQKLIAIELAKKAVPDC